MTRFGLLACVILAAAAAPASAQGATWTKPLAPCYVSVGPAAQQRQLAHIDVDGFTPLAPVDLIFDGAPADTNDDGSPNQVYADDRGHVSAQVRVPYQTDGERAFAVTVSERANPANAVSTTARVTALAVQLKPARAAPARRVRFRGRGFTKRAAIWGHYVYRGKVRATVRLAHRPAGACGRFSVRRHQIPVRKPHTGRWTLQVDQQHGYSVAPDSVFVRLDIDVRRVIGR